MSDRWSHQFWLRMAKHYAEEGSKDPSTKVGCVLVRPDRTPASWGVNGFPMGIADTDERLNDRELKLALTIHAEQNAFNFLRERAAGYTLYGTFAPCWDKCAPQIIQHQIATVVFYHADNPRWRDGQIKAVRLFREAGITVIAINPLDDAIVFAQTSTHQTGEDWAREFYNPSPTKHHPIDAYGVAADCGCAL